MTQFIHTVSFLAEQAAPEGGGLFSLLAPVLLFVGMWFLLIAPQRKKQKAHEKMLQALTSGDQVVAAGGIFGTITNVKDDRFVVKVAEGIKLEIAKNAVQSRLEEAGQSA